MNRLAALASATALLAATAAAQNTGITLSNQVDGYLEIPYSPAVVPQSGITFEAWITYDDATIPMTWRYPTIVRQSIFAQGEDYFLRVNANNTAARVLTWKVVTTSGSQFTVNWSFAAGQLLTWTHVAATWDGATAALYVNGVQVGSAVGNGQPLRDYVDPVTNQHGVLRIGKGDDAGTPMEVWNGNIDEVRLWPFARTAAEIQATMNLELASIPGLVSTWNMNGNVLDSSGGLHAASFGTVTFATNPLTLTAPVVPPAFPSGASTPGCLGPLQISLSSVATVGNGAFAAMCTRAPAAAPAFLLISFQALPAPIPVMGADLWISPAPAVLSLASVNGLGAVRNPLPIPATAPPGLGVALQFALFDPCGPQGVTASNAMTAVIL